MSMITGSKEELVQIMFETLGEPCCSEALHQYIEHVFNCDISKVQKNEHIENHHILPRSVWPEFESDDFNQKMMYYSDHVTSHFLLAKAYPIRQFISPLNWMLKGYEKYQKDPDFIIKRSEAYKLTWQKLKEDEAWYESFCETRSRYMKEAMVKGHPHYEKMVESCKKVWSEADSDYIKRRSEINQRIWDSRDDEYRKNFSEKQKESKGTAEVRAKHSESSKKIWQDESFRNKHRISMKRVHNDPEYRRKQRESQKRKWEDSEYQKKMSKRKTKPGSIIEVTLPNGDIDIVHGFNNLLAKYELNRNIVLEYIDTDEVVNTNSNARKVKNANGFKFKFIRKVTK